MIIKYVTVLKVEGTRIELCGEHSTHREQMDQGWIPDLAPEGLTGVIELKQYAEGEIIRRDYYLTGYLFCASVHVVER